jgi:hypothetical protein
MGDLFKKNWKKVTGVRPDEIPLSQDELARLKDILASGSLSGVVLSGDLDGTSDTAVVVGIQGNAVATGIPSASGDILEWDGSAWRHVTPATVAPVVAEEFRIDLPAGASLAAKIASATLPAGWSIVLANDGSVDGEIASVATDIVLIHTESKFAVSIDLVELHTTGPTALDGYTVVNTSAVPALSKSNQTGTQFSVLGFTGLITLTDQQRLFVKMLPV